MVTDSLRDRIAAVQQAHRWGIFRCDDGYARTCCRCQWRETPDGPTHAEHVADAVIAVMREEKAVKNVAFKPPLVYTYGSPEAAIHDFNRAPSYVQQDLRLVHRYVTEWKADDE